MTAATPNWATMAVGDQVKSLELDGFVALPDILGESLVLELCDLITQLPLRRSSYTDKQWYLHDIHRLPHPEIHQLIGQPRILDFLGNLFGDELVCVGASCSRSDPGYAGMPLHTDSHPYGSSVLGPLGTSPILIRVLYYLDDLTNERSPLRVVPSSHLSLHRDAMPYLRYRSHPDEVPITCKKGDAVLINQRLFHGAGANECSQPRRMFAMTFRPAWAGPTMPIPTQENGDPDVLPISTRALLSDPNRRDVDTHIVNWSEDMPTSGAGLGRQRWQSTT